MTPQPMDALLTLNAGSSSLKFRLFGLTPALPFLLGGKVSDIGGTPTFEVHWKDGSRDERQQLSNFADAETALVYVLNWLAYHGSQWHIVACVHRVVHGGPDLDSAIELSAQNLGYLESLIPLAPHHQIHNLAAVKALWASHPDMRQFACFDTAFHACHDELATTFALPASIRDQGVRRYGFHGISYSWIARCLTTDFPKLACGFVVAAHLGNGASLCAMKDGKSIDSTMGLTTLDGLPMGTRCGALDPGAVLYMQQVLNLTSDEVLNILYNESGLKGLSGITNDVAALQSSNDPRAAFALDYFALKTAQQIAAMAISLGGLDGLIFTGGIGENSEPIRISVLAHLACLAPFETYVIPANEERAMALNVFETYMKDHSS